jgi:hypothetical protein
MGKKNVESKRVEEQRPHTLPRFPPVFSLDVPLFGGRREREGARQWLNLKV